MIYTVTLNPSVDYVIQVDDLIIGSLNKMNQEAKYPGGKGINVSRVLNELNYNNTALGFLGGYTGNFIEKQMQEKGGGTNFIRIKDETRTNIKLKSSGETEINGLGPDIDSDESDQLLQQLEQITKEDTVILSGSAPPSLAQHYYEEMVKIIANTGSAFVVDTTGESLKSTLAYRPLLIKPNKEELAEIFKVTLNKQDDLIKYGRKLLDLGARNAIISMGGDGAFLFTDNGIFKGNTPKGKVQNSVGAGDSMVAGFTGKYNETKDAVEAFKWGLAAGSATAFSADLATGKAIFALLNEVEVNQIS